MKDKVREIIKNRNLTKDEIEKSLEDLNMDDSELIEILNELESECNEEICLELYKCIYNDSIAMNIEDIELLESTIKHTRKAINKGKRFILYSYAIVIFIFYLLLKGFYSSFITKTSGIVFLIILGVCYYASASKLNMSKEFLKRLLYIKSELPMMRALTKQLSSSENLGE